MQIGSIQNVRKESRLNHHFARGVPREAQPKGTLEATEGWDSVSGCTGAGPVGIRGILTRDH